MRLARDVIAAALALACLAASAAAQEPLVIRNVTVIPMTGAAPAANQTVVIRDGRIAALGPSADLPAPDGARAMVRPLAKGANMPDIRINDWVR